MYPILTINLFDIKVPDNVTLFSNFLNAAKDLASEYIDIFEKENIPVDIFHNENINYSGIQFSRYHAAASLTAIGTMEVKALELWFDLFKKNSELPVRNIQIVNETYFPEIGDQLYKYRIKDLLLKKELAAEINEMKNRFEKANRLEKYIYGNIKRFIFGHLKSEINESDFISCRVTKHRKTGKRPTYHGGFLDACDIEFQTNVYLPHTLRLGQSTALGYGRTFHL